MENQIVVVVKGVILHNNRVLIIKRDDKDDIGPGTWECVGGKIEFGEELESALIREVKEEVGLDVAVDRLLYATTFKTDPMRQVVILTYKCRAEQDKVQLSEEHSQFMWVTEEALKRLLFPAILKDMEMYGALPVIFEK